MIFVAGSGAAYITSLTILCTCNEVPTHTMLPVQVYSVLEHTVCALEPFAIFCHNKASGSVDFQLESRPVGRATFTSSLCGQTSL